MSSRPKAPVWRKLVLSLLVLVASLALCEIGLRVWLRMHGEAFSAWRTLQDIQHAADTTRSFVPAGPGDPVRPGDHEGAVMHPYTGVESWPDTGGVLLYFRTRARADDFKVLVMGGSVAGSFAGTLLSKLPDLLRDAPALAGKRVVVLDYAHAAYKEPQQVTRLVYLLSLGYRPDAVIDIDGFNEVALGFENGKEGINPVYPSPPVWGALAYEYGLDLGQEAELVTHMLATRARMRAIAADAERWHLYESSWLGRWTLARMSDLNADFLGLQAQLLTHARVPSPRMKKQLEGPEFDPADEVMIESCVRSWVEGSLMMHELCAARGIRYVQILQPTLHDTGSKPMHDAEKALPLPLPGWLTGTHLGYPLLRARVPELRAQGVPILDQSRVFADVEEPVYFDACHLSHRGELLWYERLAPALREALVGK